MTKPGDLKPGDRLDTASGVFVVARDAVGARGSDLILVDVEPLGPDNDYVDVVELPGVVSYTLCSARGYRLALRPDTDVEVTR